MAESNKMDDATEVTEAPNTAPTTPTNPQPEHNNKGDAQAKLLNLSLKHALTSANPSFHSFAPIDDVKTFSEFFDIDTEDYAKTTTQAFRDATNWIPEETKHAPPCTLEDILNMDKPVTVRQFLHLGLSWHDWYLGEWTKEAQANGFTQKNVFHTTECYLAMHPFGQLAYTWHEKNELDRPLTDIGQMYLRMLALYYHERCLVIHPMFLFHELSKMNTDVYQRMFRDDDTEEDTEIL